MPDCSRIDALVTPFVDGELPESETRAVAGHLSACPLCRAKVAAEESIRSLMQQRRRELCACAPSGIAPLTTSIGRDQMRVFEPLDAGTARCDASEPASARTRQIGRNRPRAIAIARPML